MSDLVLAADIGGTHARFGLVDRGGPRPEVKREHTYDSAAWPGLEALVEDFLAQDGEKPARACFGLAGPVHGGQVRLSNLDWVIPLEGLEARIGIERVRVINDFSAVGYAIRGLEPEDYSELRPGQPEQNGPIALVGPGTGLGHGIVVREEGRDRVLASEGGHTDFAPDTPEEWALFRYLARQFGHVSWERLLSGPGLANIYRFLVEESNGGGLLLDDADPAASISAAATDGSDALAKRAMDLFVRALGRQAGNLALTVVSTGGIYLAGGIAPRILQRLQRPDFLQAISEKGRLSPLVEAMPVRVITTPDAGLLGAAAAA